MAYLANRPGSLCASYGAARALPQAFCMVAVTRNSPGRHGDAAGVPAADAVRPEAPNAALSPVQEEAAGEVEGDDGAAPPGGPPGPAPAPPQTGGNGPRSGATLARAGREGHAATALRGKAPDPDFEIVDEDEAEDKAIAPVKAKQQRCRLMSYTVGCEHDLVILTQAVRLLNGSWPKLL